MKDKPVPVVNFRRIDLTPWPPMTASRSNDRSPPDHPLSAPLPVLALPALLLAAIVPTLLAHHQPPSATVLNQCVAFALWGGVALVLAPLRWPRGAGALLAALALVAAGVGVSVGGGSLPYSLALQALGLLLGAGLLGLVGAACAQQRTGAAPMAALAAGLWAAGLLGAAVALVQVFAPGWADGGLIAPTGLPGRAVGNLRQPNHLGSLLLWGLAATVLLFELRWLPRAAAWAASVPMVLAIELTASRTAALGLGVLLLWAVVDRRLSRAARGLLAALPLLYGLAFVLMGWWGRLSQHALGASARVAAEGAAAGAAHSPNSRLNIWRNAWDLIATNPWGGVGFGEFNLAWSLTPFPGRPTAFFDHTHNLALQLAVELGLPAAIAVLGLLLLALWQAGQRAWRADGPAGGAARMACVLVLLTLLHSTVEYPLWYAYFLLPAALAWGYALGLPAGPPLAPTARGSAASGLAAALGPAARPAPWALAAGLLMAVAGALAVLDYQRVVVIYAPGDGAGSLGERIARGQHSPLFAHHADYAAATNDAPPADAALGLARSSHSLLDTRLMLAWSRHLAAQGQVDAARWLAQRLREFRNPEADSFFEACTGGAAQPFQCQAPERSHDWREFTVPNRR